MQHFLGDFENRGLLVSRQSQAIGDSEINTISISDKIVDINYYRRGGEQVMPLYTKDTSNTKNTKKNKKDSTFTTKDSNNKESKGEWVENFTTEFRSFIDSKYNWSKEEIQANPAFFKEGTLSPEAILGYIYAVLFHKTYREKYIDFLKIDFPKIPFIESKELFLQYSALGLELINVHLMQDNNQSINQSIRGQIKMTCNIGINVARQYKMSGSWQCAIVTNTLVDRCLMGGGNTGAGTTFPLYLHQKV